MKEASWRDCVEDGAARRVSPDAERSRSLIETAQERLEVIQGLDRKNCNFVFEDYYTSLLEILQAMVIAKGFRILNHLCLGYYLRDALKRDDLFRVFDDLRYKRNSLTYYGRRMDFETAKNAIEKSKVLIREIQDLMV